MICSEASKRELAERYLAGRLPAAEMEEFESHFFECSRCSQELARLEVVSAALFARPVPMIQPSRFRLLGPPWFWIPAAALAGVIGFILIRKQETHVPNATPIAAEVRIPHTDADSKVVVSKEISPAAKSTKRIRPAPVSGTTKKPQPVTTAPESTAVASSPAPESAMPSLPTTPIEAPPTRNVVASKKKALGPEIAKAPPATGNEAEIFRLGQVEAPAYLFAGFHPVKPPKNQPQPTGESIGRGSSTYTSGPRPIFRAAMAEYSDRNFPRALTLLQEDIKNEPDAADAQFYLGVCYLVQGEQQPAIEAFERALQAPSSYSEQSHFFMAKALLQQQRLKEAEQQFDETKKLNGRLRAESERMLNALQAMQAGPAAR